MKVRFIFLAFTLFMLAGCNLSFDSQEDVVEENQGETGEETSTIPSYNISDEHYRMLLEYKPSKARGVIVNQVANRVDIDELEEGLRRHSKSVFSPDEYFFEEGQYLTEEMLYNWLDREKEKEGGESEERTGLNPPIKDKSDQEQHRDSPRYLSHIVEQNFLTKRNEEVELGGISLGIALKSTYRFQTEQGGPYYYEEIPEKEMLKEGKRIAEEVVNRIRNMEDIPDVPIMIALYREEDRNSLVPGNFTAKAVVGQGGSSVSDWEEVNEEYILFPSDEAEGKYPEDTADMKDLETQVSEYFPNYVGVIGEGFYADGQLKSMTIEIPIEFRGKAEVIGFTQYIYGLVVETIPDYYKLEINVTSDGHQESLLTREAGQEEPDVHIYK